MQRCATGSHAPADVVVDVMRGCQPPVAVTFDFWNTLVVPDMVATRAARRVAMIDVLDRRGHGVAEDALDGALDDAVRVFDRAWRTNQQFTGEDGGAHAAMLLVQSLTEAERAELVGAYVDAARSVSVELAPHVAGVLSELTGVGVRLGVICDVGMTPSRILREYLDRYGILDCFDHFSFSDEVGVYKPDAAIFADALEGLGGVHPDRAVHVGDLRRTDIAGARNFGMTSVRYRGLHDDTGDVGNAGVPGNGGVPVNRGAARNGGVPGIGGVPGNGGVPGKWDAGQGDHELPDGDHVLDDHADLIGVLGLG